MFRDFEKHLGLRVKVLNEYQDENDEGLSNPIHDLSLFEQRFKNTCKKLQEDRHKIVNDFRHREFLTFKKIKESKQKKYGPDEETPYERIDKEVQQIKQQLYKAQKGQEEAKSAYDHIENLPGLYQYFYNSESEEEKENEDDDADSQGSFDYVKKKRKHTLNDKRELYIT